MGETGGTEVVAGAETGIWVMELSEVDVDGEVGEVELLRDRSRFEALMT